MKLTIKDIYGTEIKLGFSRSGYVRFDFEKHGWPEYRHDKTKEEIPYCVSLSYREANLLAVALQSLVDDLHEGLMSGEIEPPPLNATRRGSEG